MTDSNELTNQIHAAKMREAKLKKQLLASRDSSASGAVSHLNKEGARKNFIIRTPRDIKRASKLLMEDIVNGNGKYTSVQIRNFKDLSAIWFKAYDQLTTEGRLKRMEQELKERKN